MPTRITAEEYARHLLQSMHYKVTPADVRRIAARLRGLHLRWAASGRPKVPGRED